MKKNKKYCRNCSLLTSDGGCVVLEVPETCEVKINKEIIKEVLLKVEADDV